jgi:hypothetical protein
MLKAAARRRATGVIFRRAPVALVGFATGIGAAATCGAVGRAAAAAGCAVSPAAPSIRARIVPTGTRAPTGTSMF